MTMYPCRRRTRIQRRPHTSVAYRMHMRLKPQAHHGGDGRCQFLPRPVRNPAPATAAIRLQHVCRAALYHPIGKELDGIGSQSVITGLLYVYKPRQLVAPALWLRQQRHINPHRRLGLNCGLPGRDIIGLHPGILHECNPMGCEIVHGIPGRRSSLRLCEPRQALIHQPPGTPLPQRAHRIALDHPAWRIRCVLINARERQGQGICPHRVIVRSPQRHRSIGHGLV